MANVEDLVGKHTDVGRSFQRIEQGVIVSVNPNSYACTVQTAGRSLISGVAFPDLAQDPEGGGGMCRVPRVGQKVVVQHGLGTPIILKVLPRTYPLYTSQATTFPTTEASPPLDTQPPEANFRGKLPADVLPGDQFMLGNQGQRVGIQDMMAQLYATPWAFCRANQVNDTFQIKGRNLQIQTGFGNITFSDAFGKQSMELVGGVDQASETGKENWTIRATMGGASSNLASFQLRSRAGEDLMSSQFGVDGSVYHDLQGGFTMVTRGPATMSHEAGRSTAITNGGDDLTVGGDANWTVGGQMDLTATAKLNIDSMGPRRDTCNDNWTLSSGQTVTWLVGGEKVPNPMSNAFSMQAVNGSVVFDIGKLSPPETNTAKGGFKATAYTAGGNIEMSSMLGVVALASVNPVASIWLGAVPTALGTVVPPIFHLPIFEQLAVYLTSLETWLDNFVAAFNLHTHSSSSGPTSPPTPPYPGSANGSLNWMHTAIMCQKILIGG